MPKCRAQGRRTTNSVKTFTILYQDRCLVVALKPSGMLSVPHPGADRCRTAIGVLEERLRKAGTYSYAHRPLAVHRLDRDTSGVMMFALGEKWRRIIMDSWQTMVTERLYRAVAQMPHGKQATECPLLKQDTGTIDLPLAEDKYGRTFVPSASNRLGSKGKTKLITARTHFKVLSRGKEYMLLELSLDTGRKNQIRAHLAALGCPIAGDEHRGAVKSPFGRLALHARTLAFIHPATGEQMRFEVPEDASWRSL